MINSSLKWGVIRVMLPNSAFWGTGHIFGADNTKHFTFGQQIDRNDYYHTHVGDITRVYYRVCIHQS